VKGLGLPTQLREVGVTEDKFEMISRTTMKEEMFIYTNPRRVQTWEQVRDILLLAT
jgi:alcohol dehydrogenase class IV